MASPADLSRAAYTAPGYGATRPAGVPSLSFGSPTVQQPAPRRGVAAQPPQQSTPRSARSDASNIEDPDNHTAEEIEDGAYAGAMAAIVKDMHMIASGSDHTVVRTVRIIFTVFIVFALIAIQLQVLFCIKAFVTSPMVREIRKVYGEYENIMYDGHVRDTGFGFSVGIGGRDGQYFDPDNFSKISNDLKGSVCLVPFSQPAYLCIILFIWSMSVVGELKACVLLGNWLLNIKSTKTMKETIEQQDDASVIVGMPVSMKAILFIFVILPRLLTTLLVFWLGCRWLSATLDFTEVLINAIALEFVIKLNSLLYDTLISDRSKREMGDLRLDMKHNIAHGKENDTGPPPSIPRFIGAVGWALAAGVWIYVYLVYLQMVLPDYNWDVRGPCKPWVAERFNFWRL